MVSVFLKILKEKGCAVPFILFTGRGREEVMTEAFDCGTMFYLQNGRNPRSRLTELEFKIREACGQYPAEALVPEKRLHGNTAL